MKKNKKIIKKIIKVDYSDCEKCPPIQYYVYIQKGKKK